MTAMITLLHMATELRRATRGERLEDQQLQRPQQPSILSLKGRAVAAEDVGNLAVRSGHDLTAIGRLEIFVEKIGKRTSGADGIFRNVRIDCRGFKACMSKNLLNGAEFHTSL